ncbi:MAG: YdcF family protein [Halanaerobiales bacterium]|nr:YdcF family protein [Halanaerobiales bacterium]
MYALEKILSSFLLFPGILIVLNISILIYLLKTSRHKFLKTIFLLLVLLLVVFSTGIGVRLIVIPLENYGTEISNFDDQNIEKIPVVVLGGGLNYKVGDNLAQLSNISMLRLLKGIVIADQNKMPLLYTDRFHINHSENKQSIVDIEILNKYSDIKLIIEDESKNTYENGYNTKKWMNKENYKKIYLITSAIHMRRATKVFDKLNINYIPIVSNYSHSHRLLWLDYLPNRKSLNSNINALHEWLGFFWYKIRGRI